MTQVPDDTSDRVEAAGGVTADETSPDGGDRVGASAPDDAPGMGHRPRTSLLTWGTVALVLVIVLVLVVIKITGGSSVSTPSAPTPPSAAPSAVVQGVTHIPSSVYDAVGIISPVATVTPPTVLGGQPPLERNGKAEVVFVGNEFCPYCAAERWALIASLSRFGKFSGLETMQSASDDIYPNTQTFTLAHATYTSPYVTFQFREYYSNQKDSAGNYIVLQQLNKQQAALVKKYDGGGSTTSGGSIPFVDLGNKAVIVGSSYTPSILQTLSRSQIAGSLNDAGDPVTQAIIGASNYISASVCATDGHKPSSVCTSKGVVAAAKAMKLTG